MDSEKNCDKSIRGRVAIDRYGDSDSIENLVKDPNSNSNIGSLGLPGVDSVVKNRRAYGFDTKQSSSSTP